MKECLLNELGPGESGVVIHILGDATISHKIRNMGIEEGSYILGVSPSSSNWGMLLVHLETKNILIVGTLASHIVVRVDTPMRPNPLPNIPRPNWPVYQI